MMKVREVGLISLKKRLKQSITMDFSCLRVGYKEDRLFLEVLNCKHAQHWAQAAMWEIPIKLGKKFHIKTSQTLEQVTQKDVKPLTLETLKLTQAIPELPDPSQQWVGSCNSQRALPITAIIKLVLTRRNSLPRNPWMQVKLHLFLKCYRLKTH